MNKILNKNKKLFYWAALWILIVFFITLFSGCSLITELKENYSHRVEVFENMKYPIIVVAQSDRVTRTNNKGNTTGWAKGSILLQDSDGTTVYFLDDEALGVSLVASYEKGDTLISLIK